MNTRLARLSALALLPLILIPATAPATTMTMTLDGVTVGDCGTTWTEGSCTLQVVDTVVGDYTPPGYCIFFPQAAGIALMGARLEIDVSALTGITWVEVDLREVSGDGRTRVFVYAEGETTQYFNFVMSWYDGGATDQTLQIDVSGYELGRIAISGHEALIQEVRLEGSNLVDLPGTSWGVMKSRW